MHDDIKYIWMIFLIVKIVSNENENPIFHLHFLNTNISKTKSLTFSGTVLHVGFEGSLSQIFYLGPSFYLMLCRKKYFEKLPKVTHFLR